ncbi:MAG: hypothetical protein WAK10_04160, partial [Methanoregula sp.]
FLTVITSGTAGDDGVAWSCGEVHPGSVQVRSSMTVHADQKITREYDAIVFYTTGRNKRFSCRVR